MQLQSATYVTACLGFMCISANAFGGLVGHGRVCMCFITHLITQAYLL